MNNLLPCPMINCYGEGEIITARPEIELYYAIQCKKCKGHTTPRTRLDLALRAWKNHKARKFKKTQTRRVIE
jgi:hypothetical protein